MNGDSKVSNLDVKCCLFIKIHFNALPTMRSSRSSRSSPDCYSSGQFGVHPGCSSKTVAIATITYSKHSKLEFLTFKRRITERTLNNEKQTKFSINKVDSALCIHWMPFNRHKWNAAEFTSNVTHFVSTSRVLSCCRFVCIVTVWCELVWSRVVGRKVDLELSLELS